MKHADIQLYPVRCTTCGTTGTLHAVLLRHCGTSPNHLGTETVLVDAETGHVVDIDYDVGHKRGQYDHAADECHGYWCPEMLLVDQATGEVLGAGLLAFD
jgi:hypothetical protein